MPITVAAFRRHKKKLLCLFMLGALLLVGLLEKPHNKNFSKPHKNNKPKKIPATANQLLENQLTTFDAVLRLIPSTLWLTRFVLSPRELSLAGKGLNALEILHFQQNLTQPALTHFNLTATNKFLVTLTISPENQSARRVPSDNKLNTLLEKEISAHHIKLLKLNDTIHFLLQFQSTFASLHHLIHLLVTTTIPCPLKITATREQKNRLILSTMVCRNVGE